MPGRYLRETLRSTLELWFVSGQSGLLNGLAIDLRVQRLPVGREYEDSMTAMATTETSIPATVTMIPGKMAFSHQVTKRND